jgi:hypothetical protein
MTTPIANKVGRPKQSINETILLSPKNKREIAGRIEILGQLDERYHKASEAQDWQALKKIAAEYLTIGRHGGCKERAAQIRDEANYYEHTATPKKRKRIKKAYQEYKESQPAGDP